jgi:putative oxidoreductase
MTYERMAEQQSGTLSVRGLRIVESTNRNTTLFRWTLTTAEIAWDYRGDLSYQSDSVKETSMRRLSIGLRVVVGLLFLFHGVTKLAGVQNEWRDDLEVAPWFWALTGIIQLIGAAGLFASIKYDQLAIPSGILFVLVMAGALVTHVRVEDPVSEMIVPAIVLLLAAAIAALAYVQREAPGERFTGESGARSP